MEHEKLADLEAPADPRAGWRLPAFGAMAETAVLDELVSRVLAPNASHMTLDGTNTYVIGEPGAGSAIVVDPGPDDPAHRQRVDAVLAGRDAECTLIVVTHHHVDHAAAAQSWAASYGCRIAAPTHEVAGEGGRVVGDGDHLEAGGLVLDAVTTPGHCFDHTAYRLPSGVVLTGDHVLGRGTSVVAYPDGDLVAYITSLRKLLALGPDALYPGHGPELTGDAERVVQFYLDHRAFRERQVLALLAEGPQTPRQLVERIYADVDTRLWRAAEASTRACLAKLGADEIVRAGDTAPDGQDTFRLA
jgi:glyoxylase-like metal-dependent hydrolase (beta-lactamase superfamily II)